MNILPNPSQNGQNDSHPLPEPGEFSHAYPAFGRAHVLDGVDCWCHPEWSPDVPNVLVHNVAN